MQHGVFYFLLLMLIAHTSCRDVDDERVEDRPPEVYLPPELTIEEPDSNQVYMRGDTIHMQATFTSDGPYGVHNLEVTIRESQADPPEEFFNYHDHVHTEVYDFDTHYVANFDDPIELELHFWCEDHEQQVTEEKRTIFVE